MKKLIITIIAIATMSLAATKPVCSEIADHGWKVEFTCERPTYAVKEVYIGLWQEEQAFQVMEMKTDGSRVAELVFFNKYDHKTHVIESTFDDRDVLVHKDDLVLDGEQFSILYNRMRDKYDLKRKNKEN